MNDMNKSALTEWMQRNPNLLGWESITALPLVQANRLLYDAFIRRLSAGQDITGLSGVVEIEQSDLVYHLAGYRWSALALDISRASYESINIETQARLYGGTLVRAEKPYKVLGLSVHDELDGLAVSQLLVPKNTDGRLLMDVAEGENIRVSISGDSAAQAAAGKWLQDQLAQQEQDKRQVLLAEGASDSDALGIGSAVLRTQTGVQGPALVLFASSRFDGSGSLPGSSSDFPYLLDQSAAGDAAQLLNMRLLHRNSFSKGVAGLLENPQFDELRNEDGVLTGLRASSGTLHIPPTRYQSRDYSFEGEAFALHTAGGLVADFAQDHSSQRWQGECTIAFSCLANGADVPFEYSVNFALDLHHRFHLLAAPDAEYGMLEGQFFSPWPQAQEASATRGLPNDTDEELKAQAEDFAAYAVKQAILSAMANALDPLSPEQWLQSLQLLGAGHLQATSFEVPAALAVFGPLRAGAAFGFEQDEVGLLPGARHTFVLQNPPETPLTWSLQSLPGGPSNPGTIDQQGAYRAPPKHALQGRSGQVLVQVSDDQGAQAAALVTVRQYALTANPFITTLQAGGEWVLTAASMDDGPLEWLHADEVPGESGQLDPLDEGRRCRYQAGSVVADKTYVHDQILVSRAAGDEPQSVHVLVIQRPPALVVALADAPKGDGTLQFIALFNGRPRAAKWRLAAGTGQIDEASGLYQPANGLQAPGILVMATFESEDFGLLEGHQILPLEIDQFPALSRQMVAEPARASTTFRRD